MAEQNGSQNSGGGKSGMLIPVIIVIALVAVFFLTQKGEEKPTDAGTNGAASSESAAEEDKGTIKIAYVNWACATASSHVMKAVLEQEGYEVDLEAMEAGIMWQAIAQGDFDAMTTAWLPATHAAYWEKYQDEVVDLGTNCDGAGLGIVVPSYVTIDSVAEMKEHADKFGGRIEGIDAGAGIMKKTKQLIKDYEMGEDFKLITSSGAAMVAALQSAIKNKKWVAVTGWTPHFMFARWDVKYLKDPKKSMGGAEEIHTIVREGLKDDNPEAYKILDNFKWSLPEIGAVMDMNAQDGADPMESARKWVKNNPEKVAEWVPGE